MTTQERMDALTVIGDRRTRWNSNRSSAESITTLGVARYRCQRLGARDAYYTRHGRVLGGSAFLVKGGAPMAPADIRWHFNGAIDNFRNSLHLPSTRRFHAGIVLAALAANAWLHDQIPYDVLDLAKKHANPAA